MPPLSRRAFISQAALAGAGTLLGLSCGRFRQTESTGELYVYNWSDFIGKTTISDFEREFKVKVIYDTYSSNEELLAKLQSGAKGYDVIVPSDYMVQVMGKLGFLVPLDLGRIPNLRHLEPTFQRLPFDPENRYSIPYLWGTNGIGYNAEKVTDRVDGWEILWNQRYRNRIVMQDDMRSILGITLKYLGYSANTTDEKPLNEAKRLLIEQKPIVRSYTNSYIDMLVSGDAWLVAAYSGDIYQAARESSAIKYAIPRQGSLIWVDTLAIPRNAPHKALAEQFIDYILRPAVGARLANDTWYASPNAAARPLIDARLRDDPSVYPPRAVLDRCEFLVDLGMATTRYDRIWSEIKAA